MNVLRSATQVQCNFLKGKIEPPRAYDNKNAGSMFSLKCPYHRLHRTTQ